MAESKASKATVAATRKQALLDRADECLVSGNVTCGAFQLLRIRSGALRQIDESGKASYRQHAEVGCSVEIHELVIEMKLLERRLTLYEEKYGILSEDFHGALNAGELARFDEFDESRSDFSRWKGIYETWLRRKGEYVDQLKERAPAEALRFHPTY